MHTSLTLKRSTGSSFKRGLIGQVGYHVPFILCWPKHKRESLAKDRKSTIVFAVDVAHVRALTKTFQSAGIDARYLYSGTPAPERNALIDGFKAGEFPVLINCGNCIGLGISGTPLMFPLEIVQLY